MTRPDTSNEQFPDSRASQAVVEPSYAPFVLALGITMVFWGVVTSPVMWIGGFVVFAWGLFLWISAIAQGWRK